MFIASLQEAKSLAEKNINMKVPIESFNDAVEYSQTKYKANGPAYAKLALVDMVIQDAIMDAINTFSRICMIDEGEYL